MNSHDPLTEAEVCVVVMKAVPPHKKRFPPELNGNIVTTREGLASKVESMWITLRMMYGILWCEMHLIQQPEKIHLDE